MNTFIVGTFYDKADRLAYSNISAYLRDFNAARDGCVVYTIDAMTGHNAKILARKKRLRDEQKRAELQERTA